MYKKLLSALLLSGASAAAFAQVTLTASNFNPAIGEKYINHICDTTGITPGAGGANVTWDFSSLVSTSIDTGKADACATTPNCSLFPGSSYAITSQSTHLIPYYIASSSKVSQNGYYLAADTNAVYSDPIDQIHFPFTYLTSYTDAYAGIVTLGVVSAHENGSISVSCDGYGTLMLPGGYTHTNVLREHTSQLFTDSASLFGSALVENFQIETYTWYTPDYHSPLLSILTTTQVGGTYTNKAVAYAPVAILAAPTVTKAGNNMELFPNPATDELNVKFAAPNGPVRISLMDMIGKEVAVISNTFAQGAQQVKFNTATLPKGMYIVRMQSGVETATAKVQLQ